MVIGTNYYPSVFSVGKVWPANFSIEVPKFATSDKNGSISFVPRLTSVPEALPKTVLLGYSTAAELRSAVPLAAYDFTLVSPYFIRIEVSFTVSGNPAALEFGATSYSKAKYAGSGTDIYGTKQVAVEAAQYNGFNKVTIDFEPDADNFLGEVWITKIISGADRATLVINKVEFIYPASGGGGGGGADAAPLYPTPLPSPKPVVTPAERRLLSDVTGGPPRARSIQREYAASETLAWRFSPGEAAIFDSFWRDDLLRGGAWFVADWLHPSGLPRYYRFASEPRWALLPGGCWQVTATVTAGRAAATALPGA